MDCLFLHCLNLQSIQLLIKHLGKRQSKMRCVQATQIRNLSSTLRQSGKSHFPFLPFLCQIAGGRLVLLQKGTETNQANTAHLTQIHDNALMDLLPQVSSENLDEGNLQRGDLAMHEDPCQIQLHLEPNIHLQRKSSCENTHQHNCGKFKNGASPIKEV